MNFSRRFADVETNLLICGFFFFCFYLAATPAKSV